MDWESLYCPNKCCRYCGRPFYQGYMVRNGSSHGQNQALCEACGTHVSIRHGTAYLNLHADPAIFEMAVRALAEGNSIRATARIVQVDKDTVCAWLDRAAQPCRLVMLSLWNDLHVITAVEGHYQNLRQNRASRLKASGLNLSKSLWLTTRLSISWTGFISRCA